jgi:hypothetical protein
VTTRWLCLLGVLWASTALAENQHAVLVAQVLDAQGVPDAATRRIQHTAQTLLKKLSGLAVGDGPVFKPGPRRSCAELACQREVVGTAGAPAVVLLSLRSSKGGVAFDVSFWLDGERLVTELGDAEIDSPENGLKAALDTLLPAWAKRGWGALRLDAQPGAVLKLDGKPVKLKHGELLSVPAGAHQLDVVYADGNAVLQRVEVPEGSRTRVDVTNPPQVIATAPESSGVVRAVSFGLWTGGAVLIAGSLIAGSLARQTGAGQNPCAPDSRTCSTFDVATERHRQAAAYTQTANILLGTGLVLATAGAGVFVFDLVKSRPAPEARQ